MQNLLKSLMLLWRERKFGDEIADLLGVNRRLFHSAMEEGGCRSHMVRLCILRDGGVSKVLIAVDCCNYLLPGLRRLENRYGQQILIETGRANLMAYIIENR